MNADLWQAYASTRVEFADDDGAWWAIEPQADGHGDPRWVGWLGGLAPRCLAQASQAWVITGHNPFSQVLSAELNAERHEALAAALAATGCAVRPAVGRAMAQDWAEASLLVPDASADVVLDLARRFDQNAVYRWTPHRLHIVGVHLTGGRRSAWRGFPLG